MRQKQFANRVQLYASNNRFLGNVPASEAARLHLTGGAKIHDQRGDRIRAIRLENPIGKPHKPPSGSMGKHGFTHRERIRGNDQLSQLVQFDYIHPDDRDLFRLSVLDNLV